MKRSVGKKVGKKREREKKDKNDSQRSPHVGKHSAACLTSLNLILYRASGTICRQTVYRANIFHIYFSNKRANVCMFNNRHQISAYKVKDGRFEKRASRSRDQIEEEKNWHV